jgi:hypothetical protein
MERQKYLVPETDTLTESLLDDILDIIETSPGANEGTDDEDW